MFQKSYIIIITIISGIALLGLVFIQFYWINGAIEQGRNELENKVNASMVDIIDEVNRYEAMHVMQEKDPYQLINKINQKVHGTIVYDSVTGAIHYSNASTNIQAKNKMMNDLMQELFSFGNPLPIEERLPQEVLDSIIDRVLLTNGIKAKFKFGVFNDFGEMHYANTTDEDKLLNSKYQVELFPLDMFGARYFLLMSIPDERGIVIRSMWMMLGFSALFLLIIIFAFYYTISTIVKQKKLSIIKNDFINNMTHELKTPISTISLACEALSDQDIGKTETSRERFVNMISDENKRLGTLVESVLQSAVIERGELKLKKSTVSLDEVIESAVQHINIQVQKRGGSLTIINEAKDTNIYADKVHISNVFYNLLDNAIKYTAGAPEISINVTKLVGGVVIKIKDNGIGIAKEHQNKVFEKLYRVPTGDRHDVKGFGLGLSYVKSIVENHDGEISLDSSLGKGSTFIIFLPTIKPNEDE
ncbi:sensor histidine kinase [Parvicella tangerina]|uniref:histidine kinase n=1 Tax=Parvicella tangerina TaxID=2829795 RepID=A0A916N9A6_9FLAO|nr:HAMP domain-containing sensor histidine kinase [Parvicella tangerina]CAG5076787.1 Adaptive-response sensory-kinase SasA [Parvicella tangerina]